MSSAKYYREVDSLRALAVVAVILNHLNSDWLSGGFLGVDIFFVISGFVVTVSLVNSDINQGFKSYIVNFYRKRIKRLYPALLICVLIFSTLSVMLLPSPEVFLETAFFSIFASSNIYLASHAFDYFSVSSEINPFTHTWSLGVEEQFYLLYPLIFFFIPNKKSRFFALAVLSLLSFAAFAHFKRVSPDYAFYLMPMRFWQLCLGGLIYESSLTKVFKKLNKHLIALPLALVAMVLVVTPEFSGWATLAVTVLTGLALAFIKEGKSDRSYLTLKPVLLVGFASYSLYLYHWPILVLFKNTISIDTPAFLIACVALAGVAAAVSYKVEGILRYANWSRKQILASLGVILVASSSLYVARESLFLGTSTIDYADVSFDDEEIDYSQCYPEYEEENVFNSFESFKTELKKCRWLKGKRNVFLFGNSHAEEKIPMVYEFAKKNNYTLNFWGRSGISIYFYDIINNDETFITREVAAKLTKYYFRYIYESGKRGDIVIFSAPLTFLDVKVFDENKKIVANEKALEIFFRELNVHIERLKKRGIAFYFVDGYPFLNTHAPAFCYQPWSGLNPNCTREEVLNAPKNKRVLVLDEKFKQGLGVNYISLWTEFQSIIDEQSIPTRLYYNSDHINLEGNRLLYPFFEKTLKDRAL